MKLLTKEERDEILAGLAELECKICANDLVVGEDRVCDGCLGAIASAKIDKLDARIFDLQNNVQQQAERIKALQSVCAEAYQMAGAYGASKKALDNLSAAAQGEPIPHETFLPIMPPENPLAERVKTLEDALKGTSRRYSDTTETGHCWCDFNPHLDERGHEYECRTYNKALAAKETA